jgi:predicted phosphodiesterase
MSKLALFTDVHGNLEALKAILNDIKNYNVDKIYSLGDVTGLGPKPRECVNLLMENNIVNITGNAEEYTLLGTDSFPYLARTPERLDNALWTKEQLTKENIAYLKSMKRSLIINNTALCHYPIDVRYDFEGVNDYQGENARVFLRTNSEYLDNRFNVPINQTNGFLSANAEPLFDSRKITVFNVVIYGHYHFKRIHELKNTKLYSLNGAGVAIKDKTFWYLYDTITEEISEKTAFFDYEKLYNELDNITYPNKEKFERFINRV